MRMIRAIVLFSPIFLVSAPLFSQVFMDADSTGDAYARILSKGYGYEVPDCIHPIRHITEAWDNILRKYVFVFSLHRSIDNDRCINFDRQRTEIKTWGSSPDSMKGFFRRNTHLPMEVQARCRISTVGQLHAYPSDKTG